MPIPAMRRRSHWHGWRAGGAPERSDGDPKGLERGQLSIAWAVPLGGPRRERGRFWAFVPTRTKTDGPAVMKHIEMNLCLVRWQWVEAVNRDQ